jgi:hypothetical protein
MSRHRGRMSLNFKFGRRESLLATPKVSWSPEVGQRVKIVRAKNKFEAELIGQFGEVIRRRFGVMQIKLDSERVVNIPAAFLKPESK